MSLHSSLGPRFHSRIHVAVLLAILTGQAVSADIYRGDEIHKAAWHGDLAKVKALLNGNPDLISSEDDSGMTPLHRAAMRGRTEVVEFLLASKADVSARDHSGFTPLHWAAYDGHKEVVRLLLAAKADVNARTDFGQTPLKIATQRRHRDVEQLLRDSGGQLTVQTPPAAPKGGGQNPGTTRTLDLAKVKALIAQDPNQVFISDKNGRTPLHYAAAGGSRELAELLLANHADVNPTDNDGWTPLHIAVLNDRKDVAELLLANHANVNAPKAPKAAVLPTGVPMTMADVLIATMEAKVDEGATPLHVAVRKSYKDMVELLLANKADVNAKETDGETPLHAASRGNKDVVELLLAHNADINAKDSGGNTPLHMTAKEDHKEVAELLLGHGADVNAKDNDGETPLHLAAMYGHEEVAEVLLANHADINANDNRRWTPLYRAAHKTYRDMTSPAKHKLVEQGQKEVAELLRQRGGHE